jgi:hypothetical protein
MKKLTVCGVLVAGLVCLASTAQAASITVSPSDTGWIEDGNHASSDFVMDAGWHASPGEDKHSALLRFDLSSYSNYVVSGSGTLYIYSRSRQPSAATFDLYKLRQTADDWDGNSMGGGGTPDWDTIDTTERSNAIGDGSIGSGDFSATGLRAVSISQSAIESMIQNGSADRGVMLDNGNTVANTRVFLNGITWATASQRPFLVFTALAATRVSPSDTGWIEDGNHASSRGVMDAGWHASPGEDKHSALLRFDLSTYSNYVVNGGGSLYIYARSRQPSAATFDLYKLRQTADDWAGNAMGGGGTPDWDTIDTTERSNAIGDGSIGSGDFSGTGYRVVSVSQSAIESMLQNGSADRGVLLDNGNTVANTRVFLNGIEWATASQRPYMLIPISAGQRADPTDTGWIEDGAHASSRGVMDAGWHASPGEDKHSALLRFDLSAFSPLLWNVVGDGTLFVYARSRQPNAATFNLYKLRQTADDWEGTNMGGGGTPDYDSLGVTERNNAIGDGAIGSGDFSGTGLRAVTISHDAITSMIANGSADRGVMIDNGNTVANSRIFLNGITWATPSERPYLLISATKKPVGTFMILR